MVTKSDIDAIVVEAGDNVKDDAELCLHLRQHFDARLMLIASNVSEEDAAGKLNFALEELAKREDLTMDDVETLIKKSGLNPRSRLVVSIKTNFKRAIHERRVNK